MGARSATHRVAHPFPVVFDAIVASAPTQGFRITEIDPARGRIGLRARNTVLTVAVGAVDAVTSEWVATAELRIGIFRDRHDQHFARIDAALARYLAAYYVPGNDDAGGPPSVHAPRT